MGDLKRCWKCGSEKPLDAFHRSAERADGRQSMCKDCKKRANHERLMDPEVRRRHGENVRRWGKNNPEKRRESKQRYRATENGRAVERAHSRRQRIELAEAFAARDAVKGAEIRGATVTEVVSPLVVLELHDGVCGICGEDVDPFRFDLDHIVPLTAGGFHTLENLQPAHPSCNYRKSHDLAEAA